MRRFLVAVWAAAVFLSAGAGHARYREMELEFQAGLGGGLLDYERMENIRSYDLTYSYWLNDTSTLDISLMRFDGHFDYDVFKPGRADDSQTGDWNMTAGAIGFRWKPQWDFFLDVGLGAGLGYEWWEVEGDYLKGRSGDTPYYYLIGEAQYHIRPWLSVGGYFKPLYMPMAERLEKSVTVYSASNISERYENLENALLWDAGVGLEIRIY